MERENFVQERLRSPAGGGLLYVDKGDAVGVGEMVGERGFKPLLVAL